MRKFLISAAIVGLIGGTSLALAQDHDRGGGEQRGGAPGGEQRGGAPGGEPRGGAPGGEQRGGAPGGATHAGPQQAGTPHPGGPGPGAGPRPAPAMSGPREHHEAPVAAPTSNAMRANPGPGPNNAMRGNNNGPRNDNAMRGNPGPGPNNAMRGNNNGSRNDNAMRGNPGPGPNNAMRGNNNGPRNDNAMRGNNGPRNDFSSVRNFHQNFNAARHFHAPNYRQPQGYYVHHWAWGETLPPAFWVRDYWLTDFYDYDLPPPPPGAVWVRVGNDALLIDQYSGGIIEVDYGVFY